MKDFKNYILLFSSLLMAMPLAAQDCKSLKLAADKIQDAARCGLPGNRYKRAYPDDGP
jgi:hypothetical protein